MTITVMLRVDGLTAPRLRSFLAHYWLAWERFRRVPVAGVAGWAWQPDPQFDLRHHLDVALDRFTPAQLQDWVSARLNQPLPRRRPLWKFWLAPNAEGGAALVLRLHHCYGDGMALLSVFEQICPASPRQPPAVYGAPETGDLQRWLKAAQRWLADSVGPVTGAVDAGLVSAPDTSGADVPARALDLLERFTGNSLRLVHEASGLAVSAQDSPSALRRPLLGRRQCRWSAPVPLTQFRDVARAAHTTINDVLLACVTGALRERLQLSPEALEQAVLHGAIPVDIRHRLPPELSPAPGQLGNGIGTVFVPLPVDGHSPLERLYRLKQETRRLKASWQPGVAWALTASAALLPEAVRRPAVDLLSRKASAVISNVPGTSQPRYLAGCKITEQMFWVPQAGAIGLGISIVSYAGQVQFGVVADESIPAGPEAFVVGCLAELDALSGLLVQSTRR